MAFCPKCGTTIPEGSNEKFCGVCGQPLDASAQEAAPAQAAGNDMLEKGKTLLNNVAEQAKNVDVNGLIEKAKAGDKKVIGIGAGAIVIAVVLIALLVMSMGGGYMDPINNYMKLINKQSEDYAKVSTASLGSKLAKENNAITQLFIKYDAQMGSDTSYEDYLEERNESLEEMYDAINDEYDKWKLTFEKKDAEKMDKDDVEDLQDNMNDRYEDAYDRYDDMLDEDDDIEALADQYDIKEKEAKEIIKKQMNYYKNLAEGKITEAYEVKGKFIVTADKDEYKTETVKLIVAKINGSWVYCGTEDSLSLDTEDDEEAYVLRYLLRYLTSLS